MAESETPLLDELEEGPWPSFVTEMKRAAEKDESAKDLLRQLERVTDKIRHVLDLALLVVVRQQNRVALLLQAMDALVQIQVD